MLLSTKVANCKPSPGQGAAVQLIAKGLKYRTKNAFLCVNIWPDDMLWNWISLNKFLKYQGKSIPGKSTLRLNFWHAVGLANRDLAQCQLIWKTMSRMFGLLRFSYSVWSCNRISVSQNECPNDIMLWNINGISPIWRTLFPIIVLKLTIFHNLSLLFIFSYLF